MKREVFGTTKAQEVIHAYIIENEYSRVQVIDRGATLTHWYVKALDRDIVLGFDTLAEYEANDAYLGASVGRIANRIAGAKYEWQGAVRQLTPNQGDNLLHSGPGGMSFHRWEWQENQSFVENMDDGVTLRTTVRGAEDGFPGDMQVYVTYALCGKSLHVVYAYETTEDSFVNLTNHAYFNLDASDSVGNHYVCMPAQWYTPMDANQIPTGAVETVANTPFDFRVRQHMGTLLRTYEMDLAPLRGYDHNWVAPRADATGQPVTSESADVDAVTDTEAMKVEADIRVADVGLRVSSNAPCFQMYTGNWLDTVGKQGRAYRQHAGMCVEPQCIPNDINLPTWRQSLTAAGQMYHRCIKYELVDGMEKEF